MNIKKLLIPLFPGRPKKAGKKSVVKKVRSDISPHRFPTPAAVVASQLVDNMRKDAEHHSNRRISLGHWVIEEYLGIWPFIGCKWVGDSLNTFEPVSNMDFPHTAVKA
jgi:hypothetical protein